MKLADHLITQYGNQTYHGLYAGEQNVIHVNSQKQLVIAHLSAFSHGKDCYIRTYPFRPYTRGCSLQRAFIMLQTDSAIPFDTDEQFVAWCIKGAQMPHNNATTTHSDTNAFNWQSDVIEPVSRVLVQTLVSQLVEKLTQPDRLANTVRTVARSTKLLRYLK